MSDRQFPFDFIGILVDDANVIVYRPHLNAITGSVLGSILLAQIAYWWRRDWRGHEPRTPFYKFSIPPRGERSLKLYKPGESWQEELGFTTDELNTAMRKIATKISRGVSRDAALADSLVVYWTDRCRLTWYELNEPLLQSKLAELYRSEIGDYIYNREIPVYIDNGEIPVYITKPGIPVYINDSETSAEIIIHHDDESPADLKSNSQKRKPKTTRARKSKKASTTPVLAAADDTAADALFATLTTLAAGHGLPAPSAEFPSAAAYTKFTAAAGRLGAEGLKTALEKFSRAFNNEPSSDLVQRALDYVNAFKLNKYKNANGAIKNEKHNHKNDVTPGERKSKRAAAADSFRRAVGGE